MLIEILTGDCREVLKALPSGSIHACISSPPYFGLRDYGVAGQIGLEQTPDAYVAELVAVFREVRRVLRDDGTLWLNLGDSYAAARGSGDRVSPDSKQATNVGSLPHHEA
jgi:DNA modification methylase